MTKIQAFFNLLPIFVLVGLLIYGFATRKGDCEYDEEDCKSCPFPHPEHCKRKKILKEQKEKKERSGHYDD